MMAFLGSGKTNFETRILASLLTRVLTESTRVDTRMIVIEFFLSLFSDWTSV